MYCACEFTGEIDVNVFARLPRQQVSLKILPSLLKVRFWRGSNSRPSACKADVITTTPQNQQVLMVSGKLNSTLAGN